MQASVLSNPDKDFDAFLDNPEGDLDNLPVAKPKEREQFPCEHCGGSGLWKPGRASYGGKLENKCHPCKGRGFFYTSQLNRATKKRKAIESKLRKLAEAKAGFDEQNPGLRSFLCQASSWSSFAGSLANALNTYGELSKKQLDAAVSMRAKSEARQAERDAAQAAKIAAVVPTLHTLANAFLSSSAHLLHPKLRLQTEDGLAVVLSRCGDRSKTPGQINITDGRPFGENVYYGRIDTDGRAFMRNQVPASVMATLAHFNDDPQAEIKVQGVRTGNCCCCGRTLTDPVSVASGIGPICADKWGF